MRIIKTIIPLLAAIVSLNAATQPVTVAVFDFESRDESIKDLGQKVSTLVAANLSASPDIVTVERAELEKALGEQELGLSGTVAPDTAVRVGHLTGAKVLVTGRVFRADKDTISVAKIIGTETGRVYGETAKMKPGADLSGFCEDLAKKIATTIGARSETLVAKADSREEQIKKTVETGKATKPLAISVNIPERHYGAAASDPAAQTELVSLLQQAGFEIVDAKSDKKPDIEISGEAFSAMGWRKGNLSACKARLEVKAQTRKEGNILFTGSQTSVATDLAEQTAAKTALENAVLEIAPKLLGSLNK
jgi:hypothetical protein